MNPKYEENRCEYCEPPLECEVCSFSKAEDEDYDPCLDCRVDRGDEDCCAGCEWEFLSWDSNDLPGHRD